MKKILSLFAIMAWSLCMLHATNVHVRVLIPTDSEFSTDGTIVFSWTKTGGGMPKAKTSSTDILLTREGTSRWWGATVLIPDETYFTYSIYTETSANTKDKADIGGWSPSWYVAKEKPELNIEVMALVDSSNPSERNFVAGEVAADAEDHDYRITSLDVHNIGNEITITWTADNLAPYYFIGIMDDSGNWDHSEFITVTEGKYTYLYDGDDDIHLGTIIFYPCSSNGSGMYHPYVQLFQQEADINLVGAGSIIEASLQAAQQDNTIEISWQHAGNVTRYEVQVEYLTEPLKEFIVLPQYMPAMEGKYTVTVDELKGNGDYDISLYAINADGDMVSEAYTTVTVTGMPGLGEVELSVLIPSDNDMDISYGVWFEWWDVETHTEAIVQADMDADGVRFSKKITTDKSAIRFSVCNSADASGSNSMESPVINAPQACFEMQYQRYHTWELEEADCDAPDHDYRITDIQAESLMGTLKLTLTAQDYAPYYLLEARKNGTGAYYEPITTVPYAGYNSFLFAMPFTEQANYDYRITPMDENHQQVADSKEGTIEIYPNVYIPSNMQATVAADNQTVTFTWDQATSIINVDHYTLMVGDLEFTGIIGTSFTHKFYFAGRHNWSLYVYSSTDVLLAVGHSDVPFEIIAPDYDPKDLQVVVDGQTATFTWTAHEDVAASRIVLNEYDGTEAMNAVVNGNAGLFSATFTFDEERTALFYWNVQALTGDGEPMSYIIDGPMFAFVERGEMGLEDIQETGSAQAVKILREGQLYILYQGTLYDIRGQKVK